MKIIQKSVRTFGQGLSHIDIYGQKVNLLMKKQDVHSTKVGQISSLIILGFVAFSFISLTQEMFALSNPNIVSKVAGVSSPEVNFDLNLQAFLLTPNNFFVAFGLADQYGLPIVNTPDAAYYEINIQFCHQYTVFTGQSYVPKLDCVSIPMVNCLTSGTPSNLTEGTATQRLSFGNCPNVTVWNQVLNQTYLQGISTNDEFRYITANAVKCNTSRPNNNCRTQAEIDAKLTKGFVQMLFPDRLLDQTKPGDPYSLVQKSDLFRFSNGSTTDIKYTLRHSYFQDEINFFYYFPQKIIYHVLTLTAGVQSNIVDPNVLVHFNFFLDGKRETYYRTYNNFFDILGNVGGIQGFLVFMFSLLMVPLTKLSQQVSLLNSVFSFEQEGSQGNLMKESIHQNSESRFSRRESLSPGKISKTESRIYTSNGMLKKFLNGKNKRLSLNCFEILIIGCCGKKKPLVDQGVEKIEKQMDITNIINKLIELEKLKHFLLNEHQLKLFEYIPKPVIKEKSQRSMVIPIGSKKTLQDFFSGDNEFDKKVEQALESYKNLKNSTRPQDQKLVEMMDAEIKEVFDEILMDYTNARDLSDQIYRGQTGQTLQIKDIMDEIELNSRVLPSKFSQIQSPQ